MACVTPFDAFRLATESLPDTLYRRASFRDVWLNLIPKDTYKQGTGLVQSTFTIGRSEPTSDTETWSPITLSSGDVYTGSCGSTYNDTSIGFDERTYGPEGFALKGPVICQDDLIYNFHAERFLAAYLQQLEMRAKRSYGNRYANIYDHFVPKRVADGSYTETDGGTGAPPSAPDLTISQATSQLTQEMLDSDAAELNEAGASDPDSAGWINIGEDGPVYPLYIGQEMSAMLQLNNSEFRNDTRYAFEGKGQDSPLMKRIGATRVIKNFRHVINLFPPRYTYANGAYTRVPTWIMPDATKGKAAAVNPNWKNAPYEGARILSPWVFHSEIIKPVNSAAGLNWTPKNYMGEWMFVTGGKEISDSDCFDPLKKLGRHFAEFKHAPRPIFPEFGRLIIFKRCSTYDYAQVTCS